MLGSRVTVAGAAATALLVATSSAGCSFAFVEGPPADHASRHYFDCTSSRLAPVLDATLGGLMAIGMFGSGNDNSSDSQTRIEGVAVIGASLASAAYGFIRTNRCREAKEALAERVLEPAPVPGAPFPAPVAPGARPGAPRAPDPWLAEGPPPAGPGGAPVPGGGATTGGAPSTTGGATTGGPTPSPDAGPTSAGTVAR